MKYVALLGRILYVAIFFTAVPGHFAKGTIAYAAGQGVPMADIAVPAAGVVALLGALSILLGYKARFGAFLLVLFLVPVTFFIHHFWDIGDAQAAQMQQLMFMKNLSMLGGALLICYFGSGPLSVDKGN
jgi:putative oxidoreductase